MELALLLPVLLILFLVAVDFARVYYADITVANAARVGAQYGSMSPDNASDTGTIRELARDEASNLRPQPTVQSSQGTDASGNPYVEVTVSYPFSTLMNWAGLPHNFTVQKTLRMEVAQ